MNVLSLFALTLHEQVVGLFHTFPALVAVHGIEPSHDRGDGSIIGLAHLSELTDEAYTALRVGIASVHETVYEGILQSVFLADFHEAEEMIE